MFEVSTLNPDEVHVWVVSIKQRTDSHAALQKILSAYLKSGQPITILKNEKGKPYLKDFPLHFNLSHSNALALIAVSKTKRVGVDIEKVRPMEQLERLVNRYFSPVESQRILSEPPEKRLNLFFTYWTRKEAFLKANGLGLAHHLDRFDISHAETQASISHERISWSLQDLLVDSDYKACVVLEGPHSVIELKRFS